MHKRAVLRTLACAAAWAGTGLTLSACTDAKPTFNGVDITGAEYARDFRLKDTAGREPTVSGEKNSWRWAGPTGEMAAGVEQ